MGKRGQQILAFSLIGLGVVLFTANAFNIRPGVIFWPLLLVVIGLILIFSPGSLRPSPDSKFYFAGDFTISPEELQGQELRMFAGDVIFDLTNSIMPDGETVLRVYFFAGDVDLRVPEGVGVKIATAAFVTDSKINGVKKEYVMSPFQFKTEGYEEAQQQIYLNVNCFACDLTLEQE